MTTTEPREFREEIDVSDETPAPDVAEETPETEEASTDEETSEEDGEDAAQKGE